MFQNDTSLSLARRWLMDLSAVFLGIGLLFGCSQISIPLEPVPITLQTVGVLLIILTYDTKKALATLIGYVSLGALGAPMFAEYKGGLAVLLGPTGGYILGFILAALVAIPCKQVLDCYRSVGNAFLLTIIGTSVIMASGLLWLSFYIGFTKSIQVGFLPFIIPGLIKAGILSLILRSVGHFKAR